MRRGCRSEFGRSLAIEPRPSLLRLANVQHLATAVSGTLTRLGSRG